MALLIGNETTTFTVADSTPAGKIEAFEFTALKTGTVETLEFRTNSTANTGTTKLDLGIYSNSSSTPNAVLGQGSFVGLPSTNSWIAVTGLSIPIISGTIYWLAVLSIAGTIHYNTSKASGGTGDKESSSSANTEIKATTWGSNFADGPMGFAGKGTESGAAGKMLAMVI